MGVDISSYRARIGSFCQPLKVPRWKAPAILLGKREMGLYRFFVLATLLYTSALCNSENITKNINIPQQYTWSIITDHWCVTSQHITLRPWTKTAIVGSNHLYLIIETGLLCSGLETNPGPTTYCVEDCSKGRKDSGDMIRCCLCAQWYHLECLNINKTEATGVWPCLECRKISANLKSVTDNMIKMTAIVESLTNKIDTLQKDAAKQKEELLKDNKELKDTVENLRKDVHLKSDRGGDRNAGSRYSLVIGDGCIKDIDENKLKDTKVISKPKGKLKDVQDIVSRLPDRYPGITIVAGGEDCDADPSATAQDITESYRHLIRDAKEKCENVVVSSICPRLSSTETQEKIDAVNAGLTAACNDMDGVTFLGSTSSFRLEDGSTNDGYLLADGVHLTAKAVNKLGRKLQLPSKNDNDGIATDRRKIQTQTSHNRQEIRRGRDIRCDYCAESGHIKGSCRHGQQVQCYTCRGWGHKAKFCTAE